MDSVTRKTARLKAEGLRNTLAACFLCLCLALFAARNLFGAKPDPCHSMLRCHRIAEILRSKDPSQIENLYAGGCQGAPEKIARALQLYQLHQPGSEKLILQAIPQSYKEYFATYLISSSTLYAYKTPPPGLEVESIQMSARYNLPLGCIDGSQNDMTQLARLTDFWSKVLVPIVARNSKYMPQAIGLYEFFGEASPPVNEQKSFVNLVRKLYRSNPKAFCHEVRRSEWGHWALADALTTSQDDGASPSQIDSLLQDRKCGQFGIRTSENQK